MISVIATVLARMAKIINKQHQLEADQGIATKVSKLDFSLPSCTAPTPVRAIRSGLYELGHTVGGCICPKGERSRLDAIAVCR